MFFSFVPFGRFRILYIFDVMQLNPRKENIITDILTELTKGATFSETLDTIDVLWSVPETTFKRYWKEANERFNVVSERTQAKIMSMIEDTAEERQRLGILNKMERMKILSEIAKGEIPLKKYIVADGVIQERDIVADYNDRKAAIAELNKMDGDYAPTKKDITSGGEKLPAVNFQIVIDDAEG